MKRYEKEVIGLQVNAWRKMRFSFTWNQKLINDDFTFIDFCFPQTYLNMWHDQGEWVGCWEYWFWVISYIKEVLHSLGTPKNCSCLCNQMSNLDGVWIKMEHSKWTISLLKNQNWKLLTCDSFPLIVSHIGFK